MLLEPKDADLIRLTGLDARGLSEARTGRKGGRDAAELMFLSQNNVWQANLAQI